MFTWSSTSATPIIILNEIEENKDLDVGRHPIILRHKCAGIVQQG